MPWRVAVRRRGVAPGPEIDRRRRARLARPVEEQAAEHRVLGPPWLVNVITMFPLTA